MSCRPLTLALSLTALAPALAADVLSVPGTYGTIQAAVDAAAPGDTVLIAMGNYAELVQVHGKGVNLVVDGLQWSQASVSGLDVRNVPAGQAMHVEGLLLDVPDGAPGYTPGLVARSNAGSLRFNLCNFLGESGHPGWVDGSIMPQDGVAGALVVNSADVLFTRCLFAGGAGAWLNEEDFEQTMTDGGPGLEVSNSTVTVYFGTARGGSGGSATDTVAHDGGRGGDAMLNREGGRLEVHGSSLEGGDGGTADCEFFGSICGAGGRGGDGIRQVDAGSVLVERDNSAVPGDGGFAGDGSGQASSGLPTNVEAGSATTYPASFRRFELHSPVREGELLQLFFLGEEGEGLLLFAALDTGHAPLPLRQGTFALGSALILPGVFMGTQPAPGSTVFHIDVPVPELGPGVEGVLVHFQAAFASGGDVLLAPAPTALLLDAGI